MKKTIVFFVVFMLAASLLYAQSGNLIVNGLLGVGPTINPQYPVDVQGDMNITGTYRVNSVPLIQPGLTGAISGLAIANDATYPNTMIDLKANYIGTVPVPSAGLSINCTQSGLVAGNDLDTGGLQDSTWYYIWVIYNGTTVAGLASLSSTTPTMPSGFTYKRLVAAWPTNSSGQLVAANVFGNKFFYNVKQSLGTYSANSDFASINLASFVPPQAVAWYAYSWIVSTLGVAFFTGNPSALGTAFSAGNYLTSVYGGGDSTIPIINSQTTYAAFSQAYSLYIRGFELNL